MGEEYLKGLVMTIYAIRPLGILVAYFLLRVEVSLDRVAMTLSQTYLVHKHRCRFRRDQRIGIEVVLRHACDQREYRQRSKEPEGDVKVCVVGQSRKVPRSKHRREAFLARGVVAAPLIESLCKSCSLHPSLSSAAHQSARRT